MANKNGLFARIFKRKPGGTMVGNLIRSVAKGYTGGLLGNGAMKLQEGETIEDANARLLSQGGSAAIAFNEAWGNPYADGKKSWSENMESGAMYQFLKNKLGYVVGGVVGLVLLIVYAFKRK